MPFLCTLLKSGNGRTPLHPDNDATRLAGLLCPYAGSLRRIALPRGAIFVSQLAGIGEGPTVCSIPERTSKAPQTAWLEITSDDDGLRFETDPLGTFPLWVYEDEERLVITGEVKALLALENVRVDFQPGASWDHRKRPPDFSPYRNVRRVLPGAILHVRFHPRLLVVEQGGSPLVYRPASMLPPEEYAESLDAAIEASAQSIGPGNGGWGTFLSAGIDSSVTTSFMARLHPKLQTFTLGTEHGDEYADAEDLATTLGTRHTRVVASVVTARRHFDRAVFCNETIDGLTAETLAQLGILAEAAASRGVRHVVTGYGADLLFGSMLRHELYMIVTGVDDLQSLIERTFWSGEFAPFYAWSLGVELHHLFWDPSLMNCAFRIPPEASFDGTREKLVLRRIAIWRRYLEERHAFRRKQAMTDGTQFNRILSAALGLASAYAYDDKNAACASRLSELFRSPGGPSTFSHAAE